MDVSDRPVITDSDSEVDGCSYNSYSLNLVKFQMNCVTLELLIKNVDQKRTLP